MTPEDQALMSGAGGTSGVVIAPTGHPAPTSVVAPVDTGQLAGDPAPAEMAGAVTAAAQDPLLAEQFVDPDAVGGPGPEATDRMFGRANDILDSGRRGGGKADGVLVQETEESESPHMSPEARQAHAMARADEVEQAYILDRFKKGVEQKQQAAELEALRASQAQFERLGKVRDVELQQARVVRDRMNVISNEIAREAENPAKEGLFAGQSAGGALIRAIGLAMIAAGAGMRARGGDMSGAEQAIQTIRDVSMMEVRRQQRVLQLKQGAHDAMGTIIERHMANLQDAELAAKATEADLMRIAAIKAKQYAVDAAPVIGAAESKLLLARMDQEALVAGADLNRLYGEKLRRKIDTKYTMPRRVLQQQAGRSPVAQPDAMVPQVAPVRPQDPIDAFFFDKGQAQPPDQIDPAIAEALGLQPQPTAVPAPAAPVPTAARPSVPAPVPAPAPAAPAGKADWIALMQDGRYEEALVAMPPERREFFKRARDERLKNHERYQGNRNAALAATMDDWRDRNTPNKPVSAKDSERILVSNGQRYRLNVEGGEAEKVRDAVLAADRLVAKYQRVLSIAGKYNGAFDAIPPELKGEVKTLATQIAALSSQAFDMGVIQKWDAELWKDMSGERLAEWITDPRTDFGAAARTAAQEAMRDRAMRIKAYAVPEGDAPSAPRERPTK